MRSRDLTFYDKLMISCPLSVMILAGIRDILITSPPEFLFNYRRMFDDDSDWGFTMSYAEQPRPEGLAQAFTIGRDFVATDRVALVRLVRHGEQGIGRSQPALMPDHTQCGWLKLAAATSPIA